MLERHRQWQRAEEIPFVGNRVQLDGGGGGVGGGGSRGNGGRRHCTSALRHNDVGGRSHLRFEVRKQHGTNDSW